ncbi:hypothetical protein HSX37_16130|uniref:Uncharacterized protein n=1 Tax=Dendrosporobacter quercicolus TaxID=146817 RepID=A0A1G9ZN37_9FIRM|nr:hypothetical protein [Dendrosporobacter quercicolus]NSL49564.1 hypothetical protein [Dendrosporobacter quercicolus DSM 1736]SDN22892.1 hypothetical protein SAMN04488502_11519 [Dendrosporobacter quercicolus]
MPYTKGRAASYEDLINQIVAFVTDEGIHGEDAWELMRSEPWPRGTIFKARGLEQQDSIYIGLMALNIEDGTYKNWYIKPENIARYFVWSPLGINRPGLSFGAMGAGVVVQQGTQDILYAFADVNIFAANFKALVFGVFKQYSDGLDWDEQPGGLNIDVTQTGLKNGIGTRRVLGTSASPTPFTFRLPLYPGTGYPGIGMNEAEIERTTMEFWLKKDAGNLTVITRNMGETAEYWDVAQVGMLIPYQAKMQYPFPAVVAGSSCGARSVGRMDYTFSTKGTPLVDLQIDYGRHHWMLTRGVPTFPTMAEDVKNSFSQIVLCLPDGTWQYFANQVQGMYPYLRQNTEVPVFLVDRPEKSENTRHYLLPTYCDDLRGTRHIYHQGKWLSDELTYQLESLKLVQDDGPRKNMLGYLPTLSWSSIPVSVYGEQTLNGKRHLILPNGWEDRRWFYRTGLFGEYLPDELQALEDEITGKTQQMNCVIRLED